MMTEGRQLLLRTGLTQEGIAKRVDVHRTLVARWLGGQRKPTLVQRKKLQVLFAIPSKAWDETPKKPREPPAPAEPTREPGRVDVRARIDQIDHEIRELMNDRQYKGFERAKILRVAMTMIQVLGKMTGDLDVSEKIILRSPAWRRVQSALVEALRTHPKAAKDVSTALETLAEQAGQGIAL